MSEIFLGVVVGVLAGGFSSFVAGGSGLISSPLLILFGIPPLIAVATPKFQAVGIAIGSLARFRNTGNIIWRHVYVLLPLGVLSVYLGTKLLLSIPEESLKPIIGIIVLIAVVMALVKKDTGVVTKKRSRFVEWIGYIVHAIVEIFRSAFGSGVGVLRTLVLVHFLGLSMLEATATKRIPGGLVSIIAAIVFYRAGLIDLNLGVGLFIGTLFGSYIGTHYSLKVGNVWVRRIFLAGSVVMALSLFVS